jgi:sphingolipid delta-4 desaturase
MGGPDVTGTGSAPFLWVRHPQPHPAVTKRLLAAHPELRSLIGHNAWSFVATAALVAAQTALALVLARAHASWWLVLAVAWTAGATIDHGLWVMIHEATHHLMFRRGWRNDMAGLVANLPLLVPGHYSFKRYHLRHHTYQGEYENDADLAAVPEARLVGANLLTKATWLLVFPLVQGLRPLHLKPRQFLDGTILLNCATQATYITLVLLLAGPHARLAALGYLALSMCFSIGLHPYGARWIQEHYTLTPEQETYSYYGPANRLAFNVGFHNEHHDFPSVPWNRLPAIRRIGDEHYARLAAYRSWSGLLVRFLCDRRFTLYARVVREPRDASPRRTEVTA